MSKNKVKIGITVIIILVLAVLGICGYVGYNYVQDEINGERYSSDPYTLVIEKDDFAYQIDDVTFFLFVVHQYPSDGSLYFFLLARNCL